MITHTNSKKFITY